MPGSGGANPHTIRFGVFEVDTRTGELRKRGVKLRLTDQAYRLLAVLLEHPGEVITREQLKERVWPDGTFVDFESAINKSVSQLRAVLGDSGQNPRFIETATGSSRLSWTSERRRSNGTRSPRLPCFHSRTSQAIRRKNSSQTV